MNADNLDHDKVGGDQPQNGEVPLKVPGNERGGILEGLFDKPPQEGPEQESILQGLLKGALAPEGNVRNLLQTFLGAGIDQTLPAVVGRLTSNLDLSSEKAETIVAFVLGKLSTAQPDRSMDERLDIGSLLKQVGSDQADETSALRTTGWAEELAAKTGLDVDTALEAMQTLLLLLSGQEMAPAKKKRKSTKKKTTTKPKPKTTSTKKKTTAKPKPKTTSTKKKTTTKPKPKTTSTEKKTTTKPKTTRKKPSS